MRVHKKIKQEELLKMNKLMLTPMLSYGSEIWAKKEKQNWKVFSLFHKAVSCFSMAFSALYYAYLHVLI
jgi:hypothetical protein